MNLNTLEYRKDKRKLGFALIATISVMVLLVMIALAMLSLSSIEQRASGRNHARAEARANARMALMIALGNLQQEMGPDMRISGQAALFDTDADTTEIDGVAQARWMSSYQAWGGWLNHEYQKPNLDGTVGSNLKIDDTYVAYRKPMFRKWLVSLPEGEDEDVESAVNGAGLNDDNSVVLVGKGTLGEGSEVRDYDVTRAYLIKGRNGSHAWWIGPENQKAKIDLAQKDRSLSSDEWELGQGSSAQTGIGGIDGFDGVDQAGKDADKLISRRSMRHLAVDKEDLQQRFFDLTAFGSGLPISVRTGALKKDLSLKLDGDELPSPFQFSPDMARELSIRPMSSDLLAKSPSVPGRHFASWERLRRYYRMYRQNDPQLYAGGAPDPNLMWQGSKPWTTLSLSTNRTRGRNGIDFGGGNYDRLPLMAKLTFIYSLKTELTTPPPGTPADSEKYYDCNLLYSPIVTLWNPYNVEMRLRSNLLKSLTCYRPNCHCTGWPNCHCKI